MSREGKIMKTVEQIIQLVQLGKHKEAMIKIKNILENGFDEQRFDLGEALFQLGFLDEAERLFTRLLSSYPGEGELLVILAEILMEKGQEDDAILTLEKVDEQDDVYPQALLLLADLYEMEGLYEVSEQKLLHAKKCLPDEPLIDFALGELFAAQGKLQKALQAYERVLKEQSLLNEINIYERIAETLSASGAFEEALPYFDKALNERVEINTLFQYGFTALQAGYHQLAIEKLLELKELDYEYHSLYLLLAQAYEKEGNLQLSLETIKQGIALDEFNKEMFFYGGKIALKLNKESEAEQLLREAIALEPGFIEAVITLNQLWRKQERFEEIVDLLAEIDAYGDGDPQFYWDLAVAYQQLEKYSHALNEYERAYTFFKDNEDFLVDYGYFLIEEGKIAEAGEVFNKLLLLDPSNEEYVQIVERILHD